MRDLAICGETQCRGILIENANNENTNEKQFDLLNIISVKNLEKAVKQIINV